ncbi:MAG: DNA polymerase III subunit gamma/tau [bacterium]
MSYIPLYRKWRSQNFNEIVGQEFIVQTLKNAVKSSRISHAYLFSGPRGTGKTSTARIFAKALNCVKGPTQDPCGTCDRCVKIKNGYAVDVIEIDAASNRGIDEIRDLREKVRYAPVEGKYKVYIIDEVHMLTSEAFNALLKTLEEPPVHVIFILATTEPQKVPVTIASRCQRLDFRRLSNPEIIAQIKKIADAEGIKIDDGAASLIARNSEGSMRDAISLFDQLVSFSGKSVAHDDVIAVLGTANTDLIFEFGQALGRGDAGKLFDLINRMVSEGRSVPQITKDVLLHLRNLMLVLLNSDSCIEESNEHLAKLKEQSKLFSSDRIKEMMRMISRAEIDMKWHPQARLLLEVAVMEACPGGSTPTEEIKNTEEKKPEVKSPVKFEPKPEEEKKEKMFKLSELGEKAASKPSAPGFGEISELKSKWQMILDEVKKKNVFAFISLHEGDPFRLDSGKLTVKFKKGFAFHKGRLEEDSARAVVEEAVKKACGKDIKLECVIESIVVDTSASASKVAELFGGQVVS